MIATTKNITNTDYLGEIQATTEERKLHSLAWSIHGCMKGGLITPEYYSDCMMILTGKLGFPPLEKNLKTAADFEDA